MSEAPEKVFAEHQLGAYQYFIQVVDRFNLLDLTEVVSHEEFMNEAFSLVGVFQKSYPFLDDETIHVFNENICDPIFKFQRGDCLNTDAYHELYNALRTGLIEHVLPTVKKFLYKEYGYSLEN